MHCACNQPWSGWKDVVTISHSFGVPLNHVITSPGHRCTHHDFTLPQAAYARQWEEQVRKRQAELASRAGDDSSAKQAGDGKVKPEEEWSAEPKHPGAVGLEPKQEVSFTGCYACPAFRRRHRKVRQLRGQSCCSHLQKESSERDAVLGAITLLLFMRELCSSLTIYHLPSMTGAKLEVL